MTQLLFRPFFSALVLILAVLPNSVISQNESSPSEQGLLWKITGNGLDAPCYLYGTMHVSNKVAFHLSDSFFVALNSVDQVALEQNPENWMQDIFESTLIKKTMGLYGNMANRYGQGYNNNWYEQAFSIKDPGTRELGSLLSYQPTLINGLLYRLSGLKDNFEESTYLDLFIFQSAKKMGKPVLSLEDFEGTIELSVKATSEQYKDIANGKNYGADTRSQLNGKKPTDLLQDAYRRGNLSMIDSLTRLFNPSEGYRKYFLHVRNENMVLQMDSIMQHHSLFAGVGAAHLPGKKGMINLLREKGYHLQAVSPQKSGASKKSKEKLEKTFFQVKSTNQSTLDGFLSLDAPVKMQTLPSNNSWTEMLGAEMVNGAYYMIGRYKTYAPLYGHSPESLHKRIDSLLYEFIPGEIQKRSVIKEAGFPGFDITNRTVRGDVQRYRIVVTPLEIILFKLSAVGNYLKGKRGDQAIANAHVNLPQDLGWRSANPHTGGFSVELPGLHFENPPPPHFENTAVEPEVQAFDPKTGDYFLVQRTTLHDYQYVEEDTFDLSMLSKYFAEQLNFTLVNREWAIQDDYNVLNSTWKNKDEQMLYLQTRIQGPYYYLLAARSEQRPNRFFESFKYTPLRYAKEFESGTDSTVLFTSAVIEKPSSNPLMKETYLRSLFSHDKKEKVDPIDEFRKETMLTTPAGEELFVAVDKYHDFTSNDSLRALWDDWEKAALNDSSLLLHSKKYSEDRWPMMDLALTDSNSIRTINIRYILKDGLVYTLSYISDTLSPISPYAKAVFETFEPLDTVIGLSPLEDKGAYFFQEFFSGDTARKSSAITASNYVRLKDKHFDEAKKMMASLSGDADNQSVRIGFLWDFGQMTQPGLLPYLEQMYYQVKDTVALQVPILNAIGNNKTKASTALVKKLLHHNLPLTQNNEVYQILEPFNDSLELAKQLFPQLLEYVVYEEYKEPVLGLLAELAANSHATKAMYGNYKATLMRDAKYELKRQKAKELSMKKDAKSNYDYYDDDDDYEAVVNYKLLEFAKLLYPFRDEPEVAQWMADLKATKLDEFKYRLALLWLDLDIPQPDTLFAYLSKLENKRLYLYDILEYQDTLELLPLENYNQDNVAWSLLYGQRDVEEKDSVTFIEKRLVSKGHKKGYVYFYKRKDEDEKWVLDYTGLQPVDTSKFVTTRTDYKWGESLPNNKSEEEVIDELVEDIKYQNRLRMGGNTRSSYTDFLDY